jgi:hypothetical protein
VRVVSGVEARCVNPPVRFRSWQNVLPARAEFGVNVSIATPLRQTLSGGIEKGRPWISP